MIYLIAPTYALAHLAATALQLSAPLVYSVITQRADIEGRVGPGALFVWINAPCYRPTVRQLDHLEYIKACLHSDGIDYAEYTLK